MNCPFCTTEVASNALVCVSCSRDIAVPISLTAERDDLVRKRDTVRQRLLTAKAQLEELRHRNKRRSV